jgi:hypothetical protein
MMNITRLACHCFAQLRASGRYDKYQANGLRVSIGHQQLFSSFEDCI